MTNKEVLAKAIAEIERRIRNLVQTEEEENDLKLNYPEQYGIVQGYRAVVAVLESMQSSLSRRTYMTREEEITQASLDYANKGCGVPIVNESTRTLCIALGQAFMAGAKWADSSSSLPKWEHICSFQSFVDDSVFIEGDCLRWGDSVIPLRELKRLPKK